ncbi:MAG: ATP-binding protein [Betaproteobacteria bacterium]|nr:ATP-binding protein [Betaproteobacteria bacterium]
MNDTAAIQTAVSTIDPQHPWLGLASFTEDTRQFFYGREEEVGELSRRVQRKLLTILFGQSGLGKTSILNAGIVPRLRPDGFCPVYVRVDYSAEAIKPSEQIKQAIFRATESQGTWTQSGTAVEGESLWEFLHHRGDELRDAEGKPIIPLLIFDQFEEIFTLAQADDGGRKRAAEFLEDLADLVENRPPKALEAKIDADDSVAERFDFSRADYRILISLREDYLAHLEGVKGIMPSITQNRMRLARMNGEQALAAVIKPGGKLVTQEVAEAIVRFVAGGAELRNAEVEPSLLSLICRELNNARIAQNKSEISVDLIAGSNETILAEFYERSLADQPPAVRKVIEDDLLTDSGYRENLAEERVLKAFTAANAKPDAATTLATLVNRRLLRIEERLDVRRVELTHDVLTGVVKASREERLEREALAEAEQKLAAQKEREAATRKALVRARQIAAGCAVLAVIASGSGFVAYRAQQEAVKTRAVSEASRAEAEKLLEFLLEDFLIEMQPMGRADVLARLSERTVAYYDKLPPEARNAVTQRNGAEAKVIYANSLNNVGKLDEAQKQVDQAGATLKALRAAGDNSDETLITYTRYLAMVAQLLNTRNDVPATIPLANEALEILKPIVAKADPPKKALEMAASHYQRLGDAYLRTSRAKDSLEFSAKVQSITKQLGALDVTNHAMTMRYIWACRNEGDALTRLGRLTEAKASLEPCLNLAGELLKIRAGHRFALNARAFLFAALARVEQQQMNFARQLPYLREALKIQEELSTRQAGTGTTRGPLRFAHERLWETLSILGRLQDAEIHAEQAVAVGKDERLGGDGANGIGFNFATRAWIAAERGDLAQSKAFMTQAERHFELSRAAGAGERARLSQRLVLARDRARIARAAGGDLSAARRELERSIADVKAFLKNDKAVLIEANIAEYIGVAAQLSMQQGLYQDAEALFREALSYRKPDAESSLDQQKATNDIRIRLALALARQGKRDEANSALVPARAYYALPQVIQSDNVFLKMDRANLLLAEALIHPAERAALLARAMASLDAMPASFKPYNRFGRVREEIAAEMKK